MAKKILGIDVGYDSVNLALCKNGELRAAATEPMPKGLMQDGHITSVQAMADLLREAMRRNHIHATRAAVLLPSEQVYVRTAMMPRMTVEQLKYNLPYEFTDYIEDEPKDYVFDYAMLDDNVSVEDAGGDEAAKNAMELMAVAAPKKLIDIAREFTGKAGLKLVKAAPVECAHIAIIRDAMRHGLEIKEFCILDLGYRAIRMYMYKGDKHMVTRVLEIGLQSLDEMIADALGVDVHLAHTYFISNYEDCQNQDYAVNAYNNIAVELMRALNFYRFSNPDSELSDVWLCGGGVATPRLCGALAETLDMKVHLAGEMVRSRREIEDYQKFLMAVGVTMD